MDQLVDILTRTRVQAAEEIRRSLRSPPPFAKGGSRAPQPTSGGPEGAPLRAPA